MKNILSTEQGVYKRKEKTYGVVLSFTFAALIRLWTQNGILEGVCRKS